MLVYTGVSTIIVPKKTSFSKLSFIGCVSKHVWFSKLLRFSSRSSQTIETFLDLFIAGRKRLCVSGKVVLWSTHSEIIIWSQCSVCDFLITYTYIYHVIHIYIYVKSFAYILRKHYLFKRNTYSFEDISFIRNMTFPKLIICFEKMFFLSFLSTSVSEKVN